MFLTINNLKNSYYILDFWLLLKKLETKAEQGLTAPVAKVTMVAFWGYVLSSLTWPTFYFILNYM